MRTPPTFRWPAVSSRRGMVMPAFFLPRSRFWKSMMGAPFPPIFQWAAKVATAFQSKAKIPTSRGLAPVIDLGHNWRYFSNRSRLAWIRVRPGAPKRAAEDYQFHHQAGFFLAVTDCPLFELPRVPRPIENREGQREPFASAVESGSLPASPFLGAFSPAAAPLFRLPVELCQSRTG